jgi:hypothetical protein
MGYIDRQRLMIQAPNNLNLSPMMGSRRTLLAVNEIKDYRQYNL